MFSFSPVSQPFSLTVTPNLQKNSNQRAGALTLIEAIEETPLASFIENTHPNGERVEAGLLQLGENLLSTVIEFVPQLEVGLIHTFFPDARQESNDQVLGKQTLDFMDKHLIEGGNLSLEEQFSFFKPPSLDELLQDEDATIPKSFRIVGDNGDFSDDQYNFYLQPAIEELQPTLVMNAAILDEKDNANIGLEKSLFNRMLSHLLQNKLLAKPQIEAMFAYETEALADQGIGYKPRVTAENQVVLEPFNVIA